ncbi:MAG: hydrogenase maturation protease [Peptococcaceae bacterium]|nr:hydrogenase maturation protease [Peptococcaceae bacterium]
MVVLGVGNELQKDDGVGVHVVRRLSRLSFPPSVRLIEGGTGGENLLFYFEGAERLIIIDSLDAGADPGTLFSFTPEELELIESSEPVSLHQIRVPEVLSLARKLGKLPPTRIYAVQPAEIDWGLELSSVVESRVLGLVSLVRQDIDNWLKEAESGGLSKREEGLS